MFSASANGLKLPEQLWFYFQNTSKALVDVDFIWRVVKWFNARHIRVIVGYYSASLVNLVFLGRTIKVTLFVIVENDI